MAPQWQSVLEVFVEHARTGRRTGAIMLVDRAGKLAGLFTDSDLARLFERKRDTALDRPIREVMIRGPATVPQGSMMFDAVAIMAERKISELPVIDRRGRPCGMIDITDVVASESPKPPSGPESNSQESTGVEATESITIVKLPNRTPG